MNGQHIVGVAWAADLVSTYTGTNLVPGEMTAVLTIRSAAEAGARILQIA